ncbi:macrolide family glycosyltransferase [Paenibacillus riograndensis]|uniref:Erythromycin biosynthesis protein CIII-like C-terminal domain-containing protein n=1 Tax=Paenibacillus riograndensis SBR5 TaxID=1073571 RepID=A0A0E4HF47_9BACL|nr:macrolide family glycosyltransferase [Paenibacillus riograndensis]CQR58129.1 hypothetical protein PRIO_5742 [Paenibacillus riograndensis SBR5]
MSKIVFLSFPFYSHVMPTLTLVRELVSRGEEVIYYSNESFRETIEAMGVTFRSYGHARGMFDNSATTIEVEHPKVLLNYLVPGVIEKSKKIINAILPEVMADNPDYIIRDCDAFWGKQLASVLDVPVLCYVLTFAINKTMIDAAPLYFLENVFRIPPDKGQEYLDSLGKSRLSEELDVMSKQIAMAHGIKDFDALDAFTGREELNIVYTTKEFQPFADTFDESYAFIGPNIRQDRTGVDSRIEEMSGKPLIYISLGSIYTNRPGFYQKCFDAFRDTEWQIVMSIGSLVDIGDIPVPDNFYLSAFHPQMDVLERADVFITHGGYNSVCEAVHNNVPMIMFPQGADQFTISSHLDDMEAGIYVRNSEISPRELRETAYKIYQDKKYKENGDKLKRSFQLSGGVRLAVDSIFSFLRQKGI